jgi:glycosyltransferase involved in cell wall biosynthesis
MSNNLLVSVIVPCFNSGNTISETIKSLLSQTWPNIEIIIVNDGSSETYTKAKLEEMASNDRIKIINQQNLGLASARNNGIAFANGEFILPLDADDWLEPEAINLMVNATKQLHPKTIIYSDINLQGERSGLKHTFCNPFEQLFSNQLPYCMLIPKMLFIEIGGYDKNFVKGLEDWDLNIHLLQNGYEFFKINRPLFNYRVNQNSMFNSITSKSFGSIYLSIISKYSKSYSFKSLIFNFSKAREIDSKRVLCLYFLQYILIKVGGPNIFSKVFIILNRYFKR